MKKLMYIFIVFIGFSCSKQRKSMKNEAVDISVDEVYTETHINSYEALSIQKLNAYFDLLKLKDSRPKFKEDILKQLKSFRDNNIDDNFKFIENSKIEEIKQIGETIKLSDSVSKIKLSFKIISNNKIELDTIVAIIKSEPILFEGNEIRSNKVRFQVE